MVTNSPMSVQDEWAIGGWDEATLAVYSLPIQQWIYEAERELFAKFIRHSWQAVKEKRRVPVAEFENGVMLYANPNHTYLFTGPNKEAIERVWQPIIRRYAIFGRRTTEMPLVGVKTWYF